MQQIVLEVDFPHPSYLSGGGTVLSHCSCNAWKMPPLPQRQMSIGKGLPPWPHCGHSACSCQGWSPCLPLIPEWLCISSKNAHRIWKSLCSKCHVSSCQPQQGKPQEPYFASWAQGILGQASLTELYSSPRMGMNLCTQNLCCASEQFRVLFLALKCR